MKLALIAALAVMAASPALAQDWPYIVSPGGRYLGNLNPNPYDPNSVANPYGQFGNPYSPDSINNPYGRYGNPYSSESATNPYASSPPQVVAPPSLYDLFIMRSGGDSLGY